MKKRYWIISLMIIIVAVFAGLAYWLLPPTRASIERAVLRIPRSSQTADEQKTLASLEVIDDHPFYKITFFGDYPRYLEIKERFYWAIGLPKPFCSSFSVLNSQGHALLGYNNDGNYIPIILILTDPADGYASISISTLGDSFPWFTKSFTPFDSDANRSLLLYSPYATQSGMNEMGLAISTMTDPSGEWKIDPAKDTLGPAEARRYVLDHARDVEEAIKLLSQVNVSYKGTTVSNLLLADRSGHSALLEWVGGEMVVMRNQQPWQVSTNFRVYGAQEAIDTATAAYDKYGTVPDDNPHNAYRRYIIAWETLSQANGFLSQEQSMDLLAKVSMPDKTQYSVVYDLTSGEVQIVTERNYDRVYRYQLPMK